MEFNNLMKNTTDEASNLSQKDSTKLNGFSNQPVPLSNGDSSASNNIIFPDWYVSISFGKSSSDNYMKAVTLAKAAPQYHEQMDDGKILHQAVYSSAPKEYLAFIMLYELVGNWKSSFVIINGQLVDRKIIGQLNYCYGDRCRSGNPNFCYGASYMTENPFRCHRLQISACNTPWWSFYKPNGYKWILDRNALMNRIYSYAQIYQLCPVFDYDKIISTVNAMPDTISDRQFQDMRNSNIFPSLNYHNSMTDQSRRAPDSGYGKYLAEKENFSKNGQQNSRLAFYQTTWFTILMLICCCFPVGLYTMWKYKKFNQPIRIIISAFFAVSFAISVMTGSFSDESITSSTQEIVEESQTLEPTATEPETTVPELSNRDAFIQALVANPDVTEEAAASAYDTITATLGFSEISDIDNISGTLFEANADTYHLKITVSDKLYMVICGNYNMYENDTVQYTKQDLDDRSLGGNESAYYVIAKEIISASLKNPSDAKFCSLSECQMGRNKEYVAVQGYVDATNSFGAQLRSKFVVEFKVIDLSVFSYEVVYINIDGQTSGEYVDIK